MVEKKKTGGKTISTVSEFLEFVEWVRGLDSGALLYRGLVRSNYGLVSSGERRAKTTTRAALLNYTKDMLSKAKQRRLHRRKRKLTDLELLAELQHNGMATCLIDFTRNPLVALWFACRSETDKKSKGKVVAMRTDDVERFRIVTDKHIAHKIKKFFADDKLWKWTPWQQNNRVIAQQSVFVFGGGSIGRRDVLGIKIAPDGKSGILKELDEKYGINEDYLFSDLSGFAATNAHGKHYKPEDAEGCFHLAVGYQQQGELPQAITYYDRAIELYQKHAGAYNNRGVAKSSLGELHDAIKNYDEAIELNPEYAIAYYNRGSAKGRLGKYQDAIKDFDKAIEFDPEYAKAYYNRGMAKRGMGDDVGAEGDFAKAFELDPSLRDGHEEN